MLNRSGMKKSGLVPLLTVAFVLLASTVSYSQFREDVNKSDYSGPVVREEQGPQPGNWSNLFNMEMSHSYSMNFMSYGGQFRNINAYTNTMNFFFTDRLTGRLDISLLHSPFGNSYLNSGSNGNGMGAEIMIRNAELNYEIGENSHITIQFQQQPYSPFGANPFDRYGYGNGYGFSRY